MRSAFKIISVIFFVSSCVVVAALAATIDHIVVLMEENRSFDHMLGLYKGTKRGTKGRDLYNDVKLKNGTTIRVNYTHNAPYINYCDPNHNLPPTSYKIFGTAQPAVDAPETMLHFAQYEYDHTADEKLTLAECNVMQGFTPEQLPVLTALAEEFVLFDNFFASVPGPTWPNRMFFMAATSDGLTETGPWYRNNAGQLFPGRTIFDQVEEAGGTWAIYYDDTPWELFVETIAHHPENLRTMTQFYEDAARGELPTFAFMNPRAGVNLTLNVGSNDMHPDHDVTLGEKLYRDVYQALRHSPAWNNTLFVLTYDEHGGFYDHVAPPRPVPAPDPNGVRSYPDSFDFTRGGIRIPTLLISPWVPRGLVVSDPPPAQKPDPTSVYELTSIMASARKILGALKGTAPLTKRDAWAATFEHVLDVLSEPRTDCPETLPNAPPSPSRAALEAESRMPINALQEHIMATHANLLVGEAYPDHIRVQGDVEPWCAPRLEKHRMTTLQWKASKHHVQEAQRRRVSRRDDRVPFVTGQTKGSRLAARHRTAAEAIPTINSTLLVVVQPYIEGGLANMWLMMQDAAAKSVEQRRITVSITVQGVQFCLDSANAEEGDIVGVSTCYPTPDPARNRDRAQHWLRPGDASLRPATNTSLCATTTIQTELGGNSLMLLPCSDRVSQHFSWQNDAVLRPDTAPGVIFFGDGIYAVQLVAMPS